MSRPRKDPQRLRLTGGFRPDRHGSRAAPVAAGGDIPDPPDHLTGDALDLWHRVVPELESLGVAGAVDLAALVLLCETWSRYRTAQATIAREGMTLITTNADGSLRMVRKHPAVSVADDAAKLFIRLSGELGLTPTSRQRLRIEPSPVEPSGKDRFFTKGKS